MHGTRATPKKIFSVFGHWSGVHLAIPTEPKRCMMLCSKAIDKMVQVMRFAVVTLVKPLAQLESLTIVKTKKTNDCRQKNNCQAAKKIFQQFFPNRHVTVACALSIQKN